MSKYGSSSGVSSWDVYILYHRGSTQPKEYVVCEPGSKPATQNRYVGNAVQYNDAVELGEGALATELGNFDRVRNS